MRAAIDAGDRTVPQAVNRYTGFIMALLSNSHPGRRFDSSVDGQSLLLARSFVSTANEIKDRAALAEIATHKSLRTVLITALVAISVSLVFALLILRR